MLHSESEIQQDNYLWYFWHKTMSAAKSLQSCPTLCDPIEGNPPGSPVPGILQARTLEWVTISFSNAWKWKVKVKSLSLVRLLVTPWTEAYQAPPSVGFSRQEYRSGVPLPSLIIKLSSQQLPVISFGISFLYRSTTHTDTHRHTHTHTHTHTSMHTSYFS